MRRFLKTTGIAVLCLLLALLLLTGLFRLTGRDGVFARGFQTIAAPAERLLGRGMSRLETLRDTFRAYEALEAENAALKAELARMEATVRESEGAAEENVRLRTLLGLQEARREFTLLDASVISWTASNWSSSFSIDRGSRSGVKTGDCVITETGFLVGVVTETGLYNASVRTLIDPESAVGAKLAAGGLTAVAEGDFDRMCEGKLKLSYLPDHSAPKPGDTVLTSGAGGVCPSGLVIGKLDSLYEEEGGFAQAAVVLPAAELDALRQVFLITDFSGEEQP